MGKLKTSPTVVQKYSSKLERLHNFWPKGAMKPFIFCNVVGSEDESHVGQSGTAPVGMESKRNNKEAKKIVSLTCMYCVFCIHACAHINYDNGIVVIVMW